MKALLEARNVTKVFQSGGGIGKKKIETVALREASMVISQDPASIISIAGESGSGKTTLSRLLLGLITPTDGDIYYEGKALSSMSKDEWMLFRRQRRCLALQCGREETKSREEQSWDSHGFLSARIRSNYLQQVARASPRETRAASRPIHSSEPFLSGVMVRQYGGIPRPSSRIPAQALRPKV